MSEYFGIFFVFVSGFFFRFLCYYILLKIIGNFLICYFIWFLKFGDVLYERCVSKCFDFGRFELK